MRIIIAFSILFLNCSIIQRSVSLLSVPPTNIVQSHIKSNADFSVDPCNDFYAHVCPSTTNRTFLLNLVRMRSKIIEEYSEEHPQFQEFSQRRTEEFAKRIQQFISSGNLTNLCNQNEKLIHQFYVNFLKIEEGANEISEKLKTSTCEEKSGIIQQLQDPMDKFIRSRELIKLALDGLIAHSQIVKLDQKVRQLFQKLKMAVSNLLRQTPWLHSANATQHYQDALQAINFTTFLDVIGSIQRAISAYEKSWRECVNLLDDAYSEETRLAICEVIASGEGAKGIQNHSANVYDSDKMDVLKDRLEVWNSYDNHVYIGNDFMLLANTDYLSDLYGSIGFSIAHEILHTLVIDYKELQQRTPLSPFWTKHSECVEQQSRKTCETFPTIVCNSTITFEEDAADLLAYRIVWKEYRRSYKRKTVVENYESLDDKQLFFYGAAVLFCEQSGMERVSFKAGSHSNSYQRINSLMSQMDEFADAFNCKPSDKMIRNKAAHCELLGSNAPLNRKK